MEKRHRKSIVVPVVGLLANILAAVQLGVMAAEKSNDHAGGLLALMAAACACALFLAWRITQRICDYRRS